LFIRLAVAAAAAVALVSVTAVSSTGQTSPFFVGFVEDLPKQIGSDAVTPAASLGARGLALTLLWVPGQTQIGAADAAGLDRAVGAASGMRVVLVVHALQGSQAPQDALARDQYCGYVRNVLGRYTSVRDVVIWNEPNKSLFWSPQLGADGSSAAPGAYQALLARCWDVLHAAVPGVNVIGLALSPNGNDNAGSHSPGAFIRAVGDAYRASGRQRPIMDTVGYHAYGLDAAERPWRKHVGAKPIGQGDWNKLMYNLWLAFNGTPQPIPGQSGVSIWYLEAGFQTAVDAEKAGAYTGTENVKVVPDSAGGEPESPPPAETSAAPDQHTQVLDSIRLAVCQPYVAAYFNFLLFDEPGLGGWQSGAYWADRTPKDSAPAFRQAIGEANTVSVNCDTLKGGRPSADFMPPSTPTGLAGTAGRDPLRVDLTWSASTDDASPISYRIYRNGVHVGTSTTTSWTNKTVAEVTTYSYAVRAIDAAGNLGDPSAPVSVTTPDVTAPSAPVGLTAAGHGDPARVELAWTASSDNVGVTAYEIARDGIVLGSTAQTSYADATAQAGRTYAYAVTALDAAGNRSTAATASAAVPDTVAPGAPPALTGVGKSAPRRIELSWGPSPDNVGVASYRIVRFGVQIATVTGTTFTDMAVAALTYYRYDVYAIDAAGNASPSSYVRVKTTR
jgi:fibronectin type 3 domain-containing protein